MDISDLVKDDKDWKSKPKVKESHFIKILNILGNSTQISIGLATTTLMIEWACGKFETNSNLK